jgi:hypothetical protein
MSGTVLGRKPAQGYSPRGVVACHARPADKPAGPRPGGPVQPRCGLRARAVARAQRVSAAWSPRVGRHGGVFSNGLTVASRRRGAP